MKTKSFILLMSMTIISSVLLFLQSCSQDENLVVESKYQDFLDMDVSSNVKFSQTELVIMQEAFQRMVKCIAYDGSKITFTLSTKQMNISERLFEYLYRGLKMDNDINHNTTPKIKTRAETQLTVGVGFSQTSVKLSRSETFALMNIIQNCNSVQEFGVALAAGGLSSGASALMSGFYVLKGLMSPNAMQAFGNSNASGSTFTQMNISVPGSSYYTTSYQFSY